MDRAGPLPNEQSPNWAAPAWTIALLGAAVLIPFGFGLALLPLRGVLEPAHVALILTVAVVAVATMAGRLGAALAAIAAAGTFNLVHTEPYWTLRMRHGADVLTAALLLVVGLVVGELAVRARRARSDEAALRNDVEQLNEVAGKVASGQPPLLVVVEVNRALSSLLGLRESRFDVGSWWLIESSVGRLDVDGTVIVHNAEWNADERGLPDVELELPVKCQGIVVGRYVLRPEPAGHIRLEHRQTAVALAAHAGAAIVISGG
jgi:K+-sensing histidine kinase KdpD